MENSKRGLLLLRHGIHLSKKIYPDTLEKIQCISKIPYVSAIESHMYDMLCIRPNIALVVSVTSRYQVNPDEEHQIDVKNVLKYLRRIKNLFLILDGGSNLKVEGYIDSDFMSNVHDKKSTSRCIFLCNGGSISWKSFKQPIIVDSTMEVEYIAFSEAAKEAFQFKKFIAELGVMPSDAITLHHNNNGAIALAKELRSHQKSQYIERWFHIIFECLEKKFIKVQRVNSVHNMVDSLTKPLNQQKIEAHLEKMGFKYMVNQLQVYLEFVRYMP